MAAPEAPGGAEAARASDPNHPRAQNRSARRCLLIGGLAGSAATTLVAAVVHVFAPAIRFLPIAIAQSIVRAAPGALATYFIEALGHWAIRLAVLATAAGFLLSGAVAGLLVPRITRAFGGAPLAAWALAFVGLWAVAVALYPQDATSADRGLFALASLPSYLLGAYVAARVHARLVVPGDAGERKPDPGRRYVLRSLWVGSLGLLLGAVDLTRLMNRTPDPGAKPFVAAGLKDILPPPEGAEDRAFDAIDGLSPEVTSNDLFYVVDEEILDPIIDPATWRLAVRGLVRSPLSLTYGDLLRFALEERFQTLECISNEVGGDLISTGKWIGVHLPDVLDRAGVDRRASEVVFTASSGYADSLSIDQAMDASTWLAVGLGDRVLPRAHGYPARLLSVGTYGMKNPKWLVDLEVIEGTYEGYWERRGWTKQAIVKTGSRIDTPRQGARIRRPVTIAGVAFAGDRGISRVEISTDGGRTWNSAALKRPLARVAWRQWRYDWTPELSSGSSGIVVRASDGRGVMQTSDVVDPHPDGASGYHAITVSH